MKNTRLKLFCLYGFMLITSITYSEPFDYKKEMMKRLCPPIDTTTTKELAMCLAATEPEPEYSIRITQVGNQSYIEVHIVEKNLLKQLCLYWSAFMKMKENGPFTIKTDEYKVKITENFRDKIIKTFSKVIDITRHANNQTTTLNADGTINAMVYDGPTYEFTVITNGISTNIEITYPLNTEDYRFLVTKTNQQIVNDLKNNLFNESQYDIYK